MTTIDPATARLDAETYDLRLYGGKARDGGAIWYEVSVSIARLEGAGGKPGPVHEIVFIKRPGKIGQGLDAAFRDLGIQLSRAIQDRDPLTGAAR